MIGHTPHRGVASDPGVVHQDINTAEFLVRLSYEGTYLA